MQLLGDAFAVNGKQHITALNCLLHNAGFAADPSPLYYDAAFGCPPSPVDEIPRQLRDDCRSQIFDSLLQESLPNGPVGTKYVYSDISMLVMQMVIGRLVLFHRLISPSDFRPECINVSSVYLQSSHVHSSSVKRHPNLQQQTIPDAFSLMCAFEAFVRTRVFVPLGMLRTFYLPPRALWPYCAPAENATGSGGYQRSVIQGVVSDGNAFAAGGVAGNQKSNSLNAGRI
jgi:hypothetical protein